MQVSLDDINSTYHPSKVWSHFTATAANSSNKVYDPLVLRRNFTQITRQGGSNQKYCTKVEHMVPANDIKITLEVVTMSNIVVSLHVHIFVNFSFIYSTHYITSLTCYSNTITPYVVVYSSKMNI